MNSRVLKPRTALPLTAAFQLTAARLAPPLNPTSPSPPKDAVSIMKSSVMIATLNGTWESGTDMRVALNELVARYSWVRADSTSKAESWMAASFSAVTVSDAARVFWLKAVAVTKQTPLLRIRARFGQGYFMR